MSTNGPGRRARRQGWTGAFCPTCQRGGSCLVWPRPVPCCEWPFRLLLTRKVKVERRRIRRRMRALASLRPSQRQRVLFEEQRARERAWGWS